jgi:H+/Cl- antiporter ClcA
MHGRIEEGPSGGSVVHGAIGPRKWIQVLTLLWLVGATLLGGTMVVAALVGLATGVPVVREGSGRPLPGADAVVLTVAVLLAFVGFGIGAPWMVRRMSASDPERLVTYLADAVDGSVENPGASSPERES